MRGCRRIVTCGYYSEKDAACCVSEMLEAVKVKIDCLRGIAVSHATFLINSICVISSFLIAICVEILSLSLMTSNYLSPHVRHLVIIHADNVVR